MSKSRSQDFLRGSAQMQSRMLAWTGAGVICGVVVAGLIVATAYPRLTEPEGMAISVEVPEVGPGVAEGTKVILHGRRVGEVTALDRTTAGSVQMNLVLTESQIIGLTDTFELDFRPENYFGSSAVNLVAQQGGGNLRSGMEFERLPGGDFTMSTMIESGSLTIDGTLTNQMITSLDKSVHYIDGLTPWIETGVLVADRVAATQQALPATLIDQFNEILDPLPAFVDQAVDGLTSIFNSAYNRRPDGTVGVDDAFMDETEAALSIAGSKLFGQAGALLASHGTELAPLTQIVAEAAGVIPALLDGGMNPEAVRDIVRRLDSAFVDGPSGQQLRLRVVLDDFPALAAPLGLGTVSSTDGGTP
ncbi:hypothetical protein M2405_004310 [Rhodococcus erythropolis]|uniref:Mce family protein n=1 Tax=Rhodococcus erythropolis TaxID=1833 RepID=UPI00216A2EBE|nr:Mce family protein [Rhodococcus erythropolis]MCS4256007.1 hypothetical protein [Rhodococcus erythropolis]MCW2425523.1 hypothetical protein [Rhodococcus erythropolis]